MLRKHFPLSDDLCDAIELEGTLRVYKKTSILHQQDDIFDSAAFLLSGLVALWSNTPDGEQVLLNVSGPGIMLGDTQLTDGGNWAHTCETLSECQIYRVPKPFLNTLQQNNLEFCQFLNRTLSHKLRTIFHYTRRDRFSTKKARLADILLELSRESRSDIITINQTQLSHLLGCSRPTMAPDLQLLEEQQLVQVRYSKIKLLDKQGLNEIADFNSPEYPG